MGLADRVASCAHDLEDAVHAGVVKPDDLPPVVAQLCGRARSDQLRAFITDIVDNDVLERAGWYVGGHG